MANIQKTQEAAFNQAYVKEASFEEIFQRASEGSALLNGKKNIWIRSAIKMDPNFGSKEISQVISSLKKRGYGFNQDTPSLGKFLPFKVLFFKFIASGKCQEILSKAVNSFSSENIICLKQIDGVRDSKGLIETLNNLAEAFKEKERSIDVFTVFMENFNGELNGEFNKKLYQRIETENFNGKFNERRIGRKIKIRPEFRARFFRDIDFRVPIARISGNQFRNLRFSAKF